MYQLFLIALLVCYLPGKGQDGKFTFKLSSAARTSAGVYSNDSTLVRTLWNDVKYPIGTYTKYWDGKDDKGVAVESPAKKYIVKLVTNNVKYDWEGTIGNSSDSMWGLTKHRGYYHCMRGLAFSGNYGYFCTGYSEGSPSLAKFRINTPNQKKQFFSSNTQTGDINFVAADDVNVYWSVIDSRKKSNSFVFATKTSNDTETEFPNSSPYTITHGKTYKHAISVVDNPRSRISGVAVQRRGNYLFVAREESNEIQVIDKKSGELVKKIEVPFPRSLSADEQGNLWMITGKNNVAKYIVDKDGSLSAPILSIKNLLDPAAISISPDGTELAVADGASSQQVKFFDTKTGKLLDAQGEPGGYFEDATVANDKFYFNDVLGKRQTFVAFEPNGSYWISDPGNFRVQHYNTKHQFVNRIMSLGAVYSTCVDKNNIKRAWADYLEFELDYSVPLTGSTGWKLVKNWGANVTAAYHKSEKFSDILTLANGKTYGFLHKKAGKEIVEFPPAGQLRFTGVVPLPGANYVMAKDGAIQAYSKGEIGGVSVITRYEFNGFDNNANPAWSKVPHTVCATPFLTSMDPNATPKAEFITSTGKVIIYDYNLVRRYDKGIAKEWATGYHLGAIRSGSNKWLWRTEQATTINYKGDYPGAGFFDIGNGVRVAGGSLCIVDRNVITSYHGEFWKNGQTNKYNHYLDNGLAIAQFGITRAETADHTEPAMAGNVLTPVLVKGTNGALYLFHGDESDHAGLHRWKITGLNTIKEQDFIIDYPAPAFAATANRKKAGSSELMSGLKYNSILSNDDGSGWVRSDDEINTNQYNNIFSVRTNVLSPDKLSTPDIFMRFAKQGPTTHTVSYYLGKNPALPSWRLSGLIAYPHNMPNGEAISQFFEVLDPAGKIIAIFYCKMNRELRPLTASIIGNKKVIAEAGDAAIKKSMAPFTPLQITVVNGSVSITYGKYKSVTTSPYDASAKWKMPATVRCRFESAKTGAIYAAIIGLKDLTFEKDF